MSLLNFDHLMIVAVDMNVFVEICEQFRPIPRHKTHPRDFALLERLVWEQRVAQRVRVPRDNFVALFFRPRHSRPQTIDLMKHAGSRALGRIDKG